MEGEDPSLRDLRRSQLTELARTLSPCELQTCAGHENPYTTSKYYVHLRCEDMGKKLDGLKRQKLYEDLYEKPYLDLATSSQHLDFQDVTNPSI